ncbi:MAG: immunoglobulin domain-containing protein [Halanaerobiales bacterium]
MKYRLTYFLILLILFLFSTDITQAAENVYYIHAGAVGASDGSDWTNAWTDLPDSLERGATYYVAAGTYGAHLFNDEESDSEVITIRKATVSDHGTEVGWDNSYAEGQAIFTAEQGPIFDFQRGYYIFDGQTGEGKSGHGIRIYNPMNGPGHSTGSIIRVTHNSTARHLIFEHVEVEGPGWGGTITPAITRLIQLSGDVSHLTMRYCFVHEGGQHWVHIGNSTDVLVEYCYFYRAGSNHSDYHSNGFQVYGTSDPMNFVFRYNVLENMYGVGSTNYMQIGEWSGIPSSDYEIYGNVFYESDPRTGASWVIGNTSHDITTDVKIYNNTFVGLHGTGSRLYFTNSNESNIASNNLWVDCERAPSFTNIIDHNNSNNILSSDIFVDADSGDFRLLGPVEGATDLGSRYEIDPEGIVRGQDGAWDYGAFEYFPDGLTPPAISKQPESQAVKKGSTVTFSVIASGNPAPQYQWQYNGVNIGGEESATLRLENVQLEDAGNYSVIISNSEGSISSNPATLIIAPDDDPDLLLRMDFEGNLLDSSANGFDGRWNGEENYVTGINGMAMDTSVSAENYVKVDSSPILGGMEEITIAVRARKNNAGIGGALFWKHSQYRVVINDDLIYGYLSTEEGSARPLARNLESIHDTEWHHYTLVYDGLNACFYVDGQAAGNSVLHSGTVGINNRKIYIGRDPWGESFDGQIDDFRIYKRALSEEEIMELARDTSSEESPPTIINQPESATVRTDDTVTFSVTATGNPEPDYQWQKDGQDIVGADEAIYTITEVQTDDAGDYRVVVSNSEGSVTSNPAELIVVETPPGVSALTAMAEYYTVYLSWDNPDNHGEEWDSLVIVRKKDSAPTDPADGTEIFNGNTSNFYDYDLIQELDQGQNQVNYHYAVFTYKEFDTDIIYSGSVAVEVNVPALYNKAYLKIEADQDQLDNGNIVIGQNTRGDLYSLWNEETNTIGRGPGGNETALWLYSDLIGNAENQIPAGSKIVSARLVFNVAGSSFINYENSNDIDNLNNDRPHAIEIYQITDPDNLGSPHYADETDESGIRTGLDFNYRDHRPGINIPWMNPDDNSNLSEADSGDILSLLDGVEPIDKVEFKPEVFTDGLLDSLQFDITDAVQDWADGEINHGLFVTTDKVWKNDEYLALSGVTAETGEDDEGHSGITIMPYLEIIYADSNETGDLTAPEPVENLKISAITSDIITLNWSNPDINQAVNADITGIKIVRKEGIVPYNHQDGELVTILTGESYSEIATEYVDTGLTSGTSYYYAVYTFDEEHNYSRKAWIKGTPTAVSPADAPANFTAAPEEGTALLSWDSVTGADNYRIYRESESGHSSGIRSLTAEIDASTTSYTDYLLPGKYTYWVAAVNENGEGLLSVEITIEINEDNAATSVPSSPSDLEGSGISVSDVFSDITLSWTDNSDNESVFIIEREVGEDQWKEVGRTGFNITEYIYQDTLTAGQYNYRVRAVNSAGSSQAITAQIDIEEAEGVYDISWEVISASQIKLIWNDSFYQNNSYQLELYDVTGSGVIADNDEAVDTQIISGITYCYFVNLEPGKEYRVRLTNLSDNEEMSIESDIIRTAVDSKGGLF